jgi:hypothetical protein
MLHYCQTVGNGLLLAARRAPEERLKIIKQLSDRMQPANLHWLITEVSNIQCVMVDLTVDSENQAKEVAQIRGSMNGMTRHGGGVAINPGDGGFFAEEQAKDSGVFAYKGCRSEAPLAQDLRQLQNRGELRACASRLVSMIS